MKREDVTGRSELPGKRPRLTIRPTASAIAAFVVLTIASSAGAQGYISGSPSVIVDLGVLDRLGPAPTVPGLQLPAPTGARSLSDPPPTAPISRLNPEIARQLGIAAVPVTRRPVLPATVPPPAPSPVAAPAPPVRTEPAEQPAPAIVAPATPVPPPPTLAEAPAVTSPSETPPADEKPVSQEPAPVAAAEEPAMSVPAVPQPPTAPATVALASPPAEPAAPAPAEEPEPRVAAPKLPSPTEPRESTAAVTSEAPSPTAPPAAAEEPAEVASLPPQEPGGGGVFRVGFEPGSARLSDEFKSPLEQLAQRLSADEALRIQLRAFAAGTPETSSQARRLSLSRALAVRAFLIDKGVRSTRMDVRALGSSDGEGEPDRVDIVLVQP